MVVILGLWNSHHEWWSPVRGFETERMKFSFERSHCNGLHICEVALAGLLSLLMVFSCGQNEGGDSSGSAVSREIREPIVISYGDSSDSNVFGEVREPIFTSYGDSSGSDVFGEVSEPMVISYDIGKFQFSEKEPNRSDKAVISKVVEVINQGTKFDILKIRRTDVIPECHIQFQNNIQYFPTEVFSEDVVWYRQSGRLLVITGVNRPHQPHVCAQYVYSGVTDSTWIAMRRAIGKKFIDLCSFSDFGARKVRTDMSGRRLDNY